jgi:hypothetical protein
MGQHKIRAGHDKRFRRRMRVMGIVWATCATLPFVETLVFNAHVSAGRQHLSIETYFRIGFFSVVLLTSMCFVFLVEKSHVPKLKSLLKEKIESLVHNRKELIFSSVILGSLLILVFVFGGWQAFVELLRSTVMDRLREWLLFLVIGAFLWLLGKIVLSLGESLPTGMREGVESWALGLWSSILFYGLLLFGTFLWVNFNGIGSDVWLITLTSLIKDYILLFIISGLLYLGLFKLARAKALMHVFQNKRGFLHFVVLCGIIAVCAVWADYNGLNRLRLEHLFNSEWQREYMELHVFLRDVVLLLFPIGWLLFWTFECAAHEKSEGQLGS